LIYSGLPDAVIAGKTLENDEYSYGFDTQNGEFKEIR
jgi:hypothetical protein